MFDKPILMNSQKEVTLINVTFDFQNQSASNSSNVFITYVKLLCPIHSTRQQSIQKHPPCKFPKTYI